MAQFTPNIQFLIVKGSGFSKSLDIEQTTDFPLAITYSIKDVQEPSSSKGSFSKTFTIPATGNNNEILKGIYSDSIYDSYQYVEDYDAQIFVDGMLILQGKFNIKGTTYNNIPESYSCVVFGENYKWVNALSELNLCDIDFTAGNFFPNAPSTASFGRAAMVDTWDFGEAGETIGGVQTHIVYPLVNTGKWNYQDSQTPFVSPSDLAPAFYFYNMIKCIFAAQGYTIDSDFFETEWFKRLISYLPKEEFVNTAATIEQYSFEYESSGATDFKTPLNYTNTGGTPNDCGGVVGNTWHGQMDNLVLVCPTCDPSSLITTQSISPIFDVQTPNNFGGFTSLDERTIAGWYWGCYGRRNGSSPRLSWLTADPCNSGNQYVGMDFECVACDIVNGTNSQAVTMDTAVFQTAYLGTYQFNASVTLEMDNAYEIADSVYAYDLNVSNGGATTGDEVRGTGNGGAGYDCSLSDASGYERHEGVTYVFNAYLIHYKNATGRFHVVASESERKLNLGGSSPQWYCDTYQLPSSPNLAATLGFSGVQLDILHANDKVFVYTEVTAEIRLFEGNNFGAIDKIIGLTQMKYRVNSSTFNGGLTPELIDGGSIDLAQLLPCDTLQLDWINGLTGLFNLFWQSDEETKTIKVEPRDNFFLPANQAIDWTEKLDHNNDEKNEYIYDALKRNLCFTYANDSNDGFVEERNRRRGQKCELGSHSLNLGDLYENDEQNIGSEFYAPSYMFYDNTIAVNSGAYKQPFIPVIHSDYSTIWSAYNNATLPEKIEDYSPRILSWYGLQPINQADGVTTANTWRWGYNNNTSPFEELTSYPFAGTYSDQVGTLGGSLTIGAVAFANPSLYFENSEINAISTAAPYESTAGLYDMFWELNILSLLSRPKIKRAYFKLTPTDIANLNFQKLIFLRSAQTDTYWILNKIVDFKAGSNLLTQVELFEYANTRPLKGNFPRLADGNGLNVTQQWTDYFPEIVNQGESKVDTGNLNGNLGMYSPTKAPILIVGTQSNSLPTKQSTNNATGYFDDGTRAPVRGNFNQSGNIGKNENVNVGSISIGNNQTLQKTNQIVIGDGNNRKSLSNIEMTTNGQTAVSIKNDGIFREGGGGVIYYEDVATGEIREVMTGIESVALYAQTPTKFYTRVTMNDIDLI